jgi:hypothetical protein
VPIYEHSHVFLPGGGAPPPKVNQEQFKLFMTSPEIKSYITGSIDRHPDESMAHLWESKANPDLRASIKKTGVKTPVIIQAPGKGDWNQNTRIMGNGHHRVEEAGNVQADTGHEVYLPVLYDTHYMGYGHKTREAYPNLP